MTPQNPGNGRPNPAAAAHSQANAEQVRLQQIEFGKQQLLAIDGQMAPIARRRDLCTTLATEARANGLISSSKFGVALVVYLDNEAEYHQSNITTLEVNRKHITDALAQLERMVITVPAVSGLHLGKK